MLTTVVPSSLVGDIGEELADQRLSLTVTEHQQKMVSIREGGSFMWFLNYKVTLSSSCIELDIHCVT